MEQEILQLSQKLISIPSVSGDTKQNEKILKLALRELKGFRVKKFERNKIKSLLFYTGKNEKKHKILLNAHLDVVPGTPEQFVPKIKGNRLYGRGANDMKAAAATFIVVFKNLAKDLPYDIALQIVTDEEIGGAHGTRLQVERGITADFVITGENSDLQIDNQSKGIMRIKLRAEGKTAHSAYPWLGDNAVVRLTKAIDAVLKLYPIPRKEVWRTTANLASLSTTNTASNKVPDRAEALFDIRYIPKDKESIVKRLKKATPRAIYLEVMRIDPPTFTDENNQYVQTLKSSIKVVTGRNAKCIAKHGSSDVRYFTEKGTPAIAFGPKGAGHHGDVEWVDIKSLTAYYEILKDFLLTV